MAIEDPIQAINTMRQIMSANLVIEDPNNSAALPNIYQAPLGFALASIKKDQVVLALDARIATASERGLLLIGNELGKPRNNASKANGYVVLQGTAGVTILQNTAFQSNGNTYKSKVAATIGTTSNVPIIQATFDNLSGKVMLVFSSRHNLASGNKINVLEFTSSGYNATNVVISVIDEFSLSYSATGITVSPALGSGVISYTAARIQIESDLTGSNQNLASGTVVSVQDSITNADSTGYVDFGEIGGGADIENIEVYRNRLLEFRQSYPNTFNSDRITSHIKTITGITQVKVLEATPNPGKVTIYFLRGNDVAPIPSASEVENVKNKVVEIKPWEVSPSSIIVASPTPIYITTQISLLLPNTTAMQEAIIVKVSEFIKSLGIGQKLTVAALSAAIFSTEDKYGNRIQSFGLVSPTVDVNATASQVILPNSSVIVQFS